MQQALGEYVAAVGVGAELDLVDGEEFRSDEAAATVDRHRLDRAGEIPCAGGHDLFLAGDQRDVAFPLGGDHAVVVLARQQPQREADDAGVVRQQALDGEMGLAGVGGAKHRLDAMPDAARIVRAMQPAAGGPIGARGSAAGGRQGRAARPGR